MKSYLIKKFKLTEIRKDRWKASKGLLTKQEINNLQLKRIVLFSCSLIKYSLTFPIVLLRRLYFLGCLASELERLHFFPLKKITKGSDCIIDKQSWLINGQNIILGSFVKISAFSSVMAGYASTINIGDNTIIGPNVTIVSFNHGYKLTDIPIRYQSWIDTPSQSIIIEENVWIGARAIILPGAHIGEGSVIGAGVIVRGIIPARSLVYNNGIPAQRNIND